jgi:hypothetical protein
MNGLLRIACALPAMVALLSNLALAAAAPSGSPEELRARFTSLADKLAYNQFRRPLSMESKETADSVSGGIHAIVDHPFASARATLTKPAEWCELLLLHLNTKYCRAEGEGAKTVLHVNIGAKYDQPLADSHRVDFGYEVAASRADLFQVNLAADQGPMGTREVPHRPPGRRRLQQARPTSIFPTRTRMGSLDVSR